MDLCDQARGRDCTIRLPGICNFNPETSVLAHGKLPGISGVGLKVPDLMGAIACSACHDEVDRRTRKMEIDFVRLAFFEGMMRTQYVWINEGFVTW